MPSQADFYLLSATDFSGCLPFVCQLVEKIYLQGHSSVIKIEPPHLAQALDKLLWTFRDTSFLPHQLNSLDTITVTKIETESPSVLINCRLSADPLQLNNQRLLQIVPNQAPLLQMARQHYRFYQQQGYLIQTHRLT